MTRAARIVNPSFRHTFGGRLYGMMKTSQQEYGLLSVLYALKSSIDKPRRTFLGSSANSGLKWSRACQVSPSVEYNIISKSSLSHLPSLYHLIRFVVFSDRNNHFSLDVIGM
jgi:hypothetical protein